MSDSIWEKLGRGVGKGLQKAKEYGGKLSDKSEIDEKRDALRQSHEKLGELAARKLQDENAGSLSANEEDVRAHLAEIQRCREELGNIESATEESDNRGEETES